MTVKRLLILLAVGACLLAVISGCGGSEAAEIHLTKKQFLKRGEEICSNAENEQFEGAGRYMEKHPGAGEKELVIPVGLPPIEKEAEELKALAVPKGDEAEIEAFINALEDALEAAKADPKVVLASQANPFKKPDKLASEIGFSVCANNP